MLGCKGNDCEEAKFLEKWLNRSQIIRETVIQNPSHQGNNCAKARSPEKYIYNEILTTFLKNYWNRLTNVSVLKHIFPWILEIWIFWLSSGSSFPTELSPKWATSPTSSVTSPHLTSSQLALQLPLMWLSSSASPKNNAVRVSPSTESKSLRGRLSCSSLVFPVHNRRSTIHWGILQHITSL